MKAPKIIDLDQRSQAWHDWRNGLDIDGPRITATAASVILGNNPYKTPHRLWLQMTGQAPPDATNPAMLRGQQFEDEACFAFMEKHGGFFQPTCIEHPDIPWAAASLDGLSLLGTEILEIKVPGAEVLAMAKNGVVPSHYYTQVQWQLFCCPIAIHAEFWAYNPDTKQGFRVKVLPDIGFQATLRDRCEAFRHCVLTRSTPAGDAWVATAIRWRRLKEQIESDQVQLTCLEKDLSDLMPPGLKRHEGGGVSITRVKTQPKVNWAAFLASRGLSVETLLQEYMAANAIPDSELDAFRSLDVDGFLESRKTQLSMLGELFLLQKGIDPSDLAPYTKEPDPRFLLRSITMEALPVATESDVQLGYDW